VKKKVFTGVSLLDEVYPEMRRTILHHIFTGQRSFSSVRWWVIISFFESRFWYSKVIETVSAKCRDGCLWSIFLFPIKNQTFLRANNLVFCCPDTWRYSHDLIAKKKAPINSSHMAISTGEIDDLKNWRRIDPVTATCCFSPGSRLL
jgi:hypothetical protein